MQKDTTILITGATGLVGKELIYRLSALEYTIKAVYHHQKPFELPNVQWVEGDILDVIGLEEIMQGVDIAYHCAALVSFDPKNGGSLKKLNVGGTANMVNAAVDAGVKTFIHVSSVAAIGGAENEMIQESAIWNSKEFHNEYAKSKHAAEMEVLRGEAEGLKVHMVNPSIILGCGDWDKGSSEIFKKVYNEFPYYTEGIHGFVDVKDVVTVLVALLDTDLPSGERYILNGVNTSYKTLFHSIAKQFGVNPANKKVKKWQAEIIWRLLYIKAKLTGTHSMLTKDTAHTAQAVIKYDNSKILKALPDFEFQPLEQSLQRICQEFREKYELK